MPFSGCISRQLQTPTVSPTLNSSPTHTPTPINTNNQTSTPTLSPTVTPTHTATFTLTPTQTVTSTLTPTSTAKFTVTPTPIPHIDDPSNDVSLAHVDVTKVEYFIDGETLTAVLYLMDIPDELPFDRKYDKSTLEYLWGVYIDVDNDSSTGSFYHVVYFGAEYKIWATHESVLGRKTTLQSIENAVRRTKVIEFQGGIHWKSIWDAKIDVDTFNNTITLIGKIPGINAESRIYFHTMDQHPEEGRVQDYDASIIEDVLLGGGTFLPHFVGEKVDDAVAELEERGLEYTVIEGSSTYNIGIIYEQDPRGKRYIMLDERVILYNTISVLAVDESIQHIVYDDDLQNKWVDQSWSATIDSNFEKLTHEGDRSISINLEPDGVLSLRLYSKAIDTVPYHFLEFYINSGSNAQRSFTVQLYGENNVALESVDILNPKYMKEEFFQTYTWHRILIPLSDLGGQDTNITRIELFDTSEDGQDVFYIDEIRFIGVAPAP